MRTQKAFTPDLLDRFRRLGRGTGVYDEYIPWHRVSRSDPSSRGRSHLIAWRGRHLELLSDLEWDACSFALMTPRLVDLREQFPLSLEPAPHELAAYDVRRLAVSYPGTLDLAEGLDIKHPQVHDKERSAPWVMTTDLLLTLRNAAGGLELLAVACKFDKELGSRRTIQKLGLERAYWQARGVRWLLLTPKLYAEEVARTLRRSISWFLAEPTLIDTRQLAGDFTQGGCARPLTTVFEQVAAELGVGLEVLQTAFWQAVWHAELNLDLRRGWRPHEPISLLTSVDFIALNPIASGRSSWTS